MSYDYNDKIEFIEYINSLEKEFNIQIYILLIANLLKITS